MSLLLMRDLAWLALLTLSVGVTLLALAVTQKHGDKNRQDL